MRKTKDGYSWLSNILFNMNSAKEWDKRLYYYQFLPVIPSVLGTYLGLLMPSELVRGLENKWRFELIMLYILVLSLGMMLCNVLEQGMFEYSYRNAETLSMYYEKCCYCKIMRLDYHMLENPEYNKLIGNTWNVLRSKHGFRTAIQAIPAILSSLLSFLWYGIMIGQKSLVIIALAVFQTLFNIYMIQWLRKKHKAYHQRIGKYTKKTAYISRQSMERKAGKDIRIYQMQSLFLRKYDQALASIDNIYKQIHNGQFLKAFANAMIVFILNGFSYSYLIVLLGRGEITVSSFVLYIGLIGSFSNSLNTLMSHILSLNSVNISLNYIREFLDLQEDGSWSEGVGQETISQIKQSGLQIRLKNVSYTYPNSTEATLTDINLTISAGEKLALIGLNGAGKTTLVKLLCGFYRPTKGEILINGIPLSHFSKAEYYDLVTVMFQDSTLLPLTLDKNLTGQSSEEIDRQRLHEALKLSGFLPKYKNLPLQGETPLVREANADAFDFSGGERQKLLFARALYKAAPLMILDEPTAALDPIAENEMYLNFATAAKGRTCVYISHRLSSTRFCDRILLMEEGQITEEGTHDELMAKKGRYAQLYEVQSQYYQEQAERTASTVSLGELYSAAEQEHKSLYTQGGMI